MTSDELMALEHENWIAYLTGVVSCTSQASVTRAGGVVTILTGLPFDWFNQVLIEGGRATPSDVRAAVAHARARHGPFVVRLRIGIDDRFVRAERVRPRPGRRTDHSRHGRRPDRSRRHRRGHGPRIQNPSDRRRGRHR